MADLELKPGQWYTTRGGDRKYVVGPMPDDKSYDFIVMGENGTYDEYTYDGYSYTSRSEDDADLVELLVDCDSFEWEEPEPSCPAEDVLETHRILQAGERVQEGDEYTNSLGETDATSCVGRVLSQTDVGHYRRPLPLVSLHVQTTAVNWVNCEDPYGEIQTTGKASLLVEVGRVPGGKMFFLAD